MVVVKLQGGMGNQMFQFAVAKVLSQKYNCKAYVDLSFFETSAKIPDLTNRNFELDVFNNEYYFVTENTLTKFSPDSILNRIRRKLKIKRPQTFKEKKFGYDEGVLRLKPPILLSGYFQSYRYLEDQRKQLLKAFEFNVSELDERNLEIMEQMKNSNSVAVHIRRGDYVLNERVREVHGICTEEYYLNAITYLKERENNLRFYFFSDDMIWVREKFSHLEDEKKFVDNNHDTPWKDLLLMTSCKHNIIANSSFSWWGAWLNNNPGKIVLSPRRWFVDEHLNSQTVDLIPPEWLRI